MCTAHRELFEALAAPFARSEVKSRPQGGRQLSYVTARTIMNRLDAVLGPENWWDHYQPTEKSVICFLTIRLPDGREITKEDVGEKGGDACDEDKDGFSDALKRTAVKFGPGRYLYNDGVANLVDPPSTAQIPAAPPLLSMPGPAQPTPRCEGGAGGGGQGAINSSSAPVPPPPRAGSEDSQGRGGSRVYGQARAQAPPNRRPTTGEELHYYCDENKIDPRLHDWVVHCWTPQGFSAKIIDWTPDEVRQAWPSIREHLETVKAANTRMKAAS